MLKNYISICNGFTELMNPLVEIAIHDLGKGTICHISGSLSGRKVGDQSLLTIKGGLPNDLDQVTYAKLNFDGQLVKSISIPVENKWMICINCNISVFQELESLAKIFTSYSTRMPESLFKNDWQERLNVTIHTFLQKESWSFKELKPAQKKEIVCHLFSNGAFSEKNAADYVAKTLQMGRATVFNYLREWRKS